MVMPLSEIAVIIAVGRTIGGWPTFLLLLAESLFGAWLMKREGRGAWRELRQALHEGRMPAKELVDGALILVGGALLLTPGFITDLVGFLMVAPLTRPIARRMVQGMVEQRLMARAAWSQQPSWSGDGPGTTRKSAPDVVEGETL